MYTFHLILVNVLKNNTKRMQDVNGINLNNVFIRRHTLLNEWLPLNKLAINLYLKCVFAK